MSASFSHIPVLLNEVLEGLQIKDDGIYVDGTLGGAGHSSEIAKRLGPQGHLIGIDRDDEAIAAASDRLSPYGDRVTIIRDNYGNMVPVVKDSGYEHVDGILLDLGVSSHQIDTGERGFSYMEEDAPLDMRMDRRSSLTAETIVNSYTGDDLTRILRDYGEEKFASRIAANIIHEREKAPIVNVGQLNVIIRESIPEKARRTGGNPSKRTFQALRIEVNGELSVLSDHIDEMIDLLSEGGRLCIITFHSLEDRIVKEAFRRNENPCTCPPDFPVCVCGKRPKGRVITRKPILPGQEEEAANSRSKSAKLRIFERHLDMPTSRPGR